MIVFSLWFNSYILFFVFKEPLRKWMFATFKLGGCLWIYWKKKKKQENPSFTNIWILNDNELLMKSIIYFISFRERQKTSLCDPSKFILLRFIVAFLFIHVVNGISCSNRFWHRDSHLCQLLRKMWVMLTCILNKQTFFGKT